MPDYSKGKIYKIVSPSRPDLGCYYGSTCQPLSHRMGGHRNPSNATKSRVLIDCGDAVIVLVERVPCGSKEELRRAEAHYILGGACVNKAVPGRTPAEYRAATSEYRAATAEYRAARLAEYRAANAPSIAVKNANYQSSRTRDCVVCECGSQITRGARCGHRKSQKHQRWQLDNERSHTLVGVHPQAAALPGDVAAKLV